MLVLLHVCACLLAVASGLRLQNERHIEASYTDAASKGADEGVGEQVLRIGRSMTAAPSDIRVQMEGCQALAELEDIRREGTGPNGQARVSTELLKAGIGEALAQGLLNGVITESAMGHTSPGPASLECYHAINGLGVQNSPEKGLALINHAPHLWQAIVAMFRAYNRSSVVQDGLCLLAGLFGTPLPRQAAELEVEAGAIDFLMKSLEDKSLKSNPEMLQQVYCALSDPVHEASGVAARAIANYGGPLQGIPVMVRSLNWAKESGSTFHEEHGVGLLYEAVHVAGGVLEHDDANRSFARAFAKAGLADELVPIMRKEPDDRLLQDVACEAIKWITDDNVALQEQLVEMGAMDLMVEAVKRHSHPPSPGYGTVTITCSTALLNFASTKDAWRERLRSLGVNDTLDWQAILASSRFMNSEFLMRTRWFPNSNIAKLKKVLEE